MELARFSFSLGGERLSGCSNECSVSAMVKGSGKEMKGLRGFRCNGSRLQQLKQFLEFLLFSLYHELIKQTTLHDPTRPSTIAFQAAAYQVCKLLSKHLLSPRFKTCPF